MKFRNLTEAVENLDDRLERVEQILPTLATKDDLKPLATKEELKPLATKDELKTLATKDELKALATKDDLKTLATKEDLKTLATKDELREEGERSRRHMEVLVESVRDDLRLYAERLETLDKRDARQHADRLQASNAVDTRVTRLEAASRKRRS